MLVLHCLGCCPLQRGEVVFFFTAQNRQRFTPLPMLLRLSYTLLTQSSHFNRICKDNGMILRQNFSYIHAKLTEI